MSMHKSLKSKSGLTRARNVLSREERIKKLTEEEGWSEEESVFGLPKVKVETVSLRRKPAEEEEAEPAEEDEGLIEGEGSRS